MNFAVFVALWHAIFTMLASAELAKIFTRLWADVCPQLHLKPADRRPTYADICTLATMYLLELWYVNSVWLENRA